MSKLSAHDRELWEEEILEFHYPDAVDAVTDAPMCSLCDEQFPCLRHRSLQHVIAIEAENARLRTQVERGDALGITAKLDEARDRHKRMMEKYASIEERGRKKDQVSAERHSRWADVAYARGYRDAMLWINDAYRAAKTGE